MYVADQLFATLDTRTRKWTIPSFGEILLSDTVGFVRDLPHSLIASFKSTLEEARQADLLLHVVDVSNPEAEEQAETVERVLDEIGVEVRNFILVLNKIDAVKDRGIVDILRAKYAHSVTVSALTGEGLDKLGALVGELLGQGYVEAEIVTSAGNGKLFSFLAEHAEVMHTEYEDSTAKLRCRIARNILWRINGEGTTVRIIEPAVKIA